MASNKSNSISIGSKKKSCGKSSGSGSHSSNNDNTGGSFSFSRLLDSSQDTTSKSAMFGAVGGRSQLKRRGSLFENMSRSRPSEEPSAFSFASLKQEKSSSVFSGWQKPQRRNSISNKRPRRRSGFLGFASSSSSSGTSRSLFPPTASSNAPSRTNMTVAETQGQATILNTDKNQTKDKESSVNESMTPKASGKGRQQKAPLSKTSLFGSVMKQVQQHDNSNNNNTSTPSKWSNHTPSKKPQQGPNAAYTPISQTKRSSSNMPLGSPGGFQLLDFVNNVASPFSKHSNHSHMSTTPRSNASQNSNSMKEWHNTTVTNGVLDWSLPAGNVLTFDCHPATVVNTLLQNSATNNSEGMMQFLNPTSHNRSNTKESKQHQGLAHWGSGLLFWQHPAVYPSPFVDTEGKKNNMQNDAKKSTSKGGESAETDTLHSLSRKRRRSSMEIMGGARPLSEVANVLNQKQTTKATLQTQQNAFANQRRKEWQQAFTSLYWKWISQLQQSVTIAGSPHWQKLYFYSLGQDHSVLFLPELDTEGGIVTPKIILSSSSSAFRNALRASGVQGLRLLHSWNGHLKDTIFVEEMIRQKVLAPDPKAKEQKTGRSKEKTATATSKEDNTKASSETVTEEAKNATPSKQINGTKLLMSPSSDSNSPKLEAELAALRRAQVFGENVGADVTVTIKPKNTVAAQKLSLKDLPPLYVSGWEDCAAFFEVYLNLGSTCCTTQPKLPSATSTVATTTGKKDESKVSQKKEKNDGANLSPQYQQWRRPDEIPLLICRNLGPFLHCSMKTLRVRGEMQYPKRRRNNSSDSPSSTESNDYASLEIKGGPILPCAMQELLMGMVNVMKADKGQNYGSNMKNQAQVNGEDSDSDHESNRGDNDNDAMVGSHNLILRSIADTSREDVSETEAAKHVILGLPRPQFFNHSCNENRAFGAICDNENHASCASVPKRHALSMIVWDILHERDMAYKLEPVASSYSTSALSRL